VSTGLLIALTALEVAAFVVVFASLLVRIQARLARVTLMLGELAGTLGGTDARLVALAPLVAKINAPLQTMMSILPGFTKPPGPGTRS